jgi:hypothetical protein
VQHHPKKEIGVEVAVDTYLLERVARLGPTVVAQFGKAFACDVQVDAVLVEEVEDGVDGSGGQVIAKGAFIPLYSRWFHGWR